MNLTRTLLTRLNESEENSYKLNPKLFSNAILKDDVRDHLVQIAEEFIDSFTIDLDVSDINIVGSNAGYNYKSKSDIDLHLITNYNDYPADVDIIEELFNAKKSNFNNNYDITIYGLPVEIYIEDSNSPAESNGRYSVITNEWLQEPEYINEPEVNEELFKEYSAKIKEAINSNDIDTMDAVMDEIWDNRKESIKQDGFIGEFNLVFKKLRAEGLLDDIRDAKSKQTEKELSIK